MELENLDAERYENDTPVAMDHINYATPKSTEFFYEVNSEQRVLDEGTPYSTKNKFKMAKKKPTRLIQLSDDSFLSASNDYPNQLPSFTKNESGLGKVFPSQLNHQMEIESIMFGVGSSNKCINL